MSCEGKENGGNTQSAESTATRPGAAELCSHVRQRSGSSSTSGSPTTPLPSLTGRAHQRFDGDRRLVCGCVAFRVDASSSTGTGSGSGAQLSVLLVQSKKKEELIFAKGGWEQFETAPECATREFLEEAGAEGVILAALPAVDFSSKKGKRSRMFPFLLQVTDVHEHWAEEGERKREWIPMEQLETTLRRMETKAIWIEARAELHKLGFIDQHDQAVYKAPPTAATAATVATTSTAIPTRTEAAANRSEQLQ